MPGSKKVPGRALWYPISLWLMLNPFVLEDWGKFLEHADGGAVKLPAKPLVGRSASPAVCDALVFFGATGDLAYKNIFPALHNMIQHKTLNVPVIGVAKAGWTLDQLRERATTRTRQPSRSSARCSAGRLTRRTTSPSHPSPSPRLSRAWGAAGGGSPRHRHWRMVQPEGNPMKPTSPSTRIPKGPATIRRVVADLVSSFKTPATSAT